jgi:hypothetical protein
MSGLSTAVRALSIAAVAASISLATTAQSQAATCSIQFNVVKAGFFVGVSGGNGTLTCGRRSYPLSIGGVSLGATFGASSAHLAGRAYNVRSPSDVAGTYGATQAGLAVITGRKVSRLRNANGVVLQIGGRQVGLEFALDLSGLQIGMR